jgi:hypothetical protein
VLPYCAILCPTSRKALSPGDSASVGRVISGIFRHPIAGASCARKQYTPTREERR